MQLRVRRNVALMEDGASLWVEADGEQGGEGFFLPLPQVGWILLCCQGVQVDNAE